MPKYRNTKTQQFIIHATRDGNRSYFEHDDRSRLAAAERWNNDRYNHRPEDRKVHFKGWDRGGRVRKRGAFNKKHGPGSRYRLDDDDVDMVGGQEQRSSGNVGRYIPYTRNERKKRRGGKGMQGTDFSPAHSSGPGWNKIVVCHGSKYEKTFILRSVANLLDIPFSPIYYHTEGGNASFYVEDQVQADAIRDIDRRITTPDGYKLNFRVYRNNPVPNIPIDESVKEKLKQVMSKRYKTETKALNLRSFHLDEDLKDSMYLPLSRPNVLNNVLQVITEHIPETVALDLSENKLSNLDQLSVLPKKIPNIRILYIGKNRIRDIGQLDRLQGLPLEDLQLEGNPLCDKLPDRTSYVSAVRKRFPKVVRLDGIDLPPPIGFDVHDDAVQMPTSKGSCFCKDESKAVVLKFLETYFSIYDSEDRQPLLDAYHDNAMFSLTSAYPPGQSSSNSAARLNHYNQETRNLMRVTDFDRRQKLLRQGKLGIVSFLSGLPKTQHDPASISVDVPLFTSHLLVFSVSGVFKEPGDKHPPLRSFSRVFVIVPQGTGFCITNEELFITNATVEQIKAAFKAPDPTPSPSPIPHVQNTPGPAAVSAPVLSPCQPDEVTKQHMVASFAEQSGMSQAWSLKCLEENSWDFNYSAYVFTEMHKQGKVPPEAFVK